MSSSENDDTLMRPRQEYREDDDMGGSANDVDIALTASASGKKVNISGPPGPFSLAPNSGAHRFNFTLTDNTNLGVQFASLDRQDNTSTCPPASGDNSQQISGIVMNSTDAHFTDNNSNNAANGPMDVSFQWNFTCNDSSMNVGTYDPIISNGGKS